MRLFGFLFLLLFFILPVGLVGLLILKMVKKTKASEWEGEIIDKLYRTKEERDEGSIIKNKKKVSHFYTLVVKTNEGLTRKVAVSKEMYDSCQIGDKLIKPKGALNPRKA
ncbi:MAG: DUF7489 domain-containing protein [Microgenomates group bacterium]